MKIRSQLTLANVIATFALLISIIAWSRTSGDHEPKLTSWYTYEGSLADYSVEIDESTHDDRQPERLVHLNPKNGYSEPQPLPFAITGHDYDNDGKWDRILISRDSSSGYDSIAFIHGFWGDKVVWEPCMMSEQKKVKPFTEKEIALARTMLAEAMRATYNKDKRVNALEESRRKSLMQSFTF